MLHKDASGLCRHRYKTRTDQSTAAAKPLRPSTTPGCELNSAILALRSACTACQADSAVSPSWPNAYGAATSRELLACESLLGTNHLIALVIDEFGGRLVLLHVVFL